jgi:hypothetical protein
MNPQLLILQSSLLTESLRSPRFGLRGPRILTLNLIYMEWSAQITEKTAVDLNGVMSYSFTILGDGELKGGVITVTGNPDAVQQLIAERVTTFAQAYELADTLPAVGEVLEIITTE